MRDGHQFFILLGLFFLRMSLAQTSDLSSMAAALRPRREWLLTCRPRLESQREFLKSRAAMQLLTPDEKEILDSIPYDLETVDSQLALVDEALALTKCDRRRHLPSATICFVSL